LTNTWNN